MSYFIRYNAAKAGPAPLFSLCVTLGLATALFFASVPAPVALAAGAVQKPLSARLIIPTIRVNAAIQEMGLTPDGAMAVPNNTIDVGWFEPGTHPGEVGSAVIGGHNRWGHRDAVFSHLDELKKETLCLS